MAVKKLHVMTQDDQPYMSERKCCERCAYAYWVWGKDDRYVTDHKNYTKEVAESGNLIRCCDCANRKFIMGTSVRITVPGTNKINIQGKIVGYSRDGKRCWIIRNGFRTREAYHINFLSNLKEG